MILFLEIQQERSHQKAGLQTLLRIFSRRDPAPWGDGREARWNHHSSQQGGQVWLVFTWRHVFCIREMFIKGFWFSCCLFPIMWQMFPFLLLKTLFLYHGQLVYKVRVVVSNDCALCRGQKFLDLEVEAMRYETWETHRGSFCNRHTQYRASLVAGNKVSACQCRRHSFHPWVGKIPWRRKWQPNPVTLPGKSHGQRTWWATVHGVARVEHDLATKQLILKTKSMLNISGE